MDFGKLVLSDTTTFWHSQVETGNWKRKKNGEDAIIYNLCKRKYQANVFKRFFFQMAYQDIYPVLRVCACAIIQIMRVCSFFGNFETLVCVAGNKGSVVQRCFWLNQKHHNKYA